jgi:hypothetical protein
MAKNKEIECLLRLDKLENGIDQIIEHLLSEYLVNADIVKTIKKSSEPAKELYLILKDLSTKRTIQLIEYEWTVLPIERIKLTIVSNISHKEFTHNF